MTRQGQMLSIQVLRAIAALVVVAGHAGQETTAIAVRLGASDLPMGWFNWGWGVDIFFVISGFIMIHTSADHFGQPGAARDFIRRRFIRIVPLYWFMTTALILGAMLAPRLLNVPVGDWTHVAASYLFIPDARPDGGIRPVVALGWTLNYEMFFYVLFALCMLLPLRKGLAALCALFALLLAAGQMGPWNNVPVDFWTSPLLAEFLLGVVIGLVWRRGIRLSAREGLYAVVLAIMSALVLGPALSLGNALPEVLRSGLPAALLVSAGALAPDLPQTRLARWFGFLGNASYALYLVHPFVIRPMREIWLAAIGAKLPVALYLAVALALSCMVAALLHLLFEKPATRILSNLTGRRGSTLRASSSPA